MKEQKATETQPKQLGSIHLQNIRFFHEVVTLLITQTV